MLPSARRCGEAAGSHLLISQRVSTAVDRLAMTEPVGELWLKGFVKPVPAFSVHGLKD
jgi:class 3 adenylate cyclase